MENRQFPQAEAALRRAIALAPDEPMEWGTLGWVLWQQDKGAEARADLERAIALDPELPELHNNLANVEWGTGDQAAAEQQFREALRIQPGVAEWRLNLARVLATRGEIPEARFQFEQAIRLKPDSAEARLDYGRLLADHRELAAAIRQLETAVRLQPDLWRAHFELAMALGQSGNASGRAGAVDHCSQRLGRRSARAGAGRAAEAGTVSDCRAEQSVTLRLAAISIPLVLTINARGLTPTYTANMIAGLRVVNAALDSP